MVPYDLRLVTVIVPPAPRMLPALDDANRAFWTGGSTGRLLVPRCSACSRFALPPPSSCPVCGAEMLVEAVTGRATLLTWTLNSYQYHPDVPPPTLIAIVELVEQAGLRLATNLVNCGEADLTPDMPVKVLFERHGEVYYPVFEPVSVPT